MKSIVIAGASGFGREVVWVIKRMNPGAVIAGFCDDDPQSARGLDNDTPFLGDVESTLDSHRDASFFCAIGNNKARKKIVGLFDRAGVELLTVIDPTAVMAPGSQVGAGSFVGVNSVVSVGCKLGRGGIINHNVTVGHDVKASDFVQLCPGVRVSGGCELGEGALLGSNSCTIPGKIMGNWSTLGAGAVLLSDLEDDGSRIRIR